MTARAPASATCRSHARFAAFAPARQPASAGLRGQTRQMSFGRPARSPARGRSAGTAGRCACMAASAGVRGAKVKTIRRRVRCASRASAADRVGFLVVDQRIHRHDGVELADGSPTACRRRGTRCGLARWSCGSVSRGEADDLGREVDADDVGAAARQFDRHRAGAAAGVENAPAGEIVRQRWTASRRACCARPARTVARMRPSGASVAKRFQASTAVRSK